jgi:hypothetical protein
MPPMAVADEYQSRSRGYRQRLVRDDAWVGLPNDLASMDAAERKVIIVLCRQRRHVRRGIATNEGAGIGQPA